MPMEWVKRYDMRPVSGGMPTVWDGQGDHSLTQLWVRDNPPRPLDFASLTALADAFFPRVFVRRATLVPVGTVTMTVYFHADSAQLQASGSSFLCRPRHRRRPFATATSTTRHNCGTRPACCWLLRTRLCITKINMLAAQTADAYRQALSSTD